VANSRFCFHLRGSFLLMFPRCLLSSAGAVAMISAFLIALSPLRADERYLEPQREVEAEKEIRKSARESMIGGEKDDGPPIAFSDILADPGNVELNFRYARQQVRRGDIKGAAATLERILIQKPNFMSARVFYAVVLFRLDNIEEAEKAFRGILDMNPDPTFKREVEAYLEAIAQRRKMTRLTASVSFGWHYDSNRNSATDSKQRLVSDVLINTPGTNGVAGWLTIATFDLVHDLGFQDRHEVFTGATIYMDNLNELDALDIESYSVYAGGVYHGAWLDITPSVQLSQIRTGQETFLRQSAYKLEAGRFMTPSLYVAASAWTGYRQFNPVSNNRLASEYSGHYWETMVSADYALSPRHRIAAHLSRERKFASRTYNAYLQDEIRLTHTWLLGGGQFLLTDGKAGITHYERPDPFISARTRKDKYLRVSLTYGATLSFLGELVGLPELPDPLGNVILSIGGEHYRQISTLTNYSYRNNKGQVLLTKRWNF